MKIITTPWKSELMELVSNSTESIKITSPFVKENICNEVLSKKQTQTKFELITSFKLPNLHSGSLDLSALDSIIEANGIVKNFPRLHSKIYLFDDKKVIITSGNLTNGGLISNYEYGIYSDDKLFVSKVALDFDNISNNENTGIVKKSDINVVKEILSKVPKAISQKLPKYDIETPEEIFDVLDIPNNSITSSLSGWKLEVFKCVNSIPNQFFSLREVNEFESNLKKIYPSNNRVKDKIRQQLQYLRDLGLIEFLGNGQYKKLWK
jgi:Dam-replacing HTH domain/PLD-like domain